MRATILTSILAIPVTLGMATHQSCYKPFAVISNAVVNAAEAKCLATMIYGEARGESEKGMVAVAYTAVNRATKKTVCQVVLAPKQYSIFNNNPALKAAAMSAHLQPTQKNIIDEAGWKKAMQIANTVLSRMVADPTNGATHYVAYKSLNRIPRWTYTFQRVAEIGNHTFFKV